MIDPAHLQAQARKKQHQVEFLESYNDRRNGIHPDDEVWCTDDDSEPCARCAPLVQTYDEIRASLPKLVVWAEDAVEWVLYWYWRIRIRLRRDR